MSAVEFAAMLVIGGLCGRLIATVQQWIEDRRRELRRRELETRMPSHNSQSWPWNRK